MSGLSHLRTVAPPLGFLRRGLGVLASRSYACEAVASDYSLDEEYGHRRVQLEPVNDAAGSVPRRGAQWVMIGEPAAMRHVCAERIAKLLEVPHISMATLARQEMDPRSELNQQIAKAVNEGKRVPESVIFTILSKRLEEGYNRGESGFILEGIPRTLTQAELLDQIADIDLVVNFKCNRGKNVSHSSFPNLLGRIYPGCHLSSQSPYERTKPSVSTEFRTYAEQGKLLEDYYRQQNKLLDFGVARAPAETWRQLLAVLRLCYDCSNVTEANSSTI